MPVTITSLSGVNVTQNFAPATDSAAATALIPALCGNRVYSIVETEAYSIVSIIAPVAALDPLVADWTLSF